MPRRTSSGTTLRPDLDAAFPEFDIDAGERGYIAYQVLPIINVQNQAGTFGRIPVEELLKKREINRAPGSGYSRSGWTFVDESYSTKEYGTEEPVDDREAEMYRHYFEAELESARIATGVVLTEAERRVAAKIFDTTTWSGAALTTAVTTPWSTHATATPIADVHEAVQRVWDGSGLWPNAIILTIQAFRELRQCAEIVERIESGGAGESSVAGRITARQIAQVFDLDRVIIAGATGNSANEGAPVAFDPIWNKTMAMVCRTATGNSFREPCLGRTFHWMEDGSEERGHIETYRDDAVRSNIVRVRHDVDEKILYPEAGHLLTGVLTA